MYIPGSTENEIIGFVHGYLTAQGKKLKLMDNLELFIENKYGIKGHNSRWIGQIDEYPDRKGYTWETAFRRLMLEMFSSDINKSIEKLILEIDRHLENHKGSEWIPASDSLKKTLDLFGETND